MLIKEIINIAVIALIIIYYVISIVTVYINIKSPGKKAVLTLLNILQCILLIAIAKTLEDIINVFLS